MDEQSSCPGSWHDKSLDEIRQLAKDPSVDLVAFLEAMLDRWIELELEQDEGHGIKSTARLLERIPYTIRRRRPEESEAQVQYDKKINHILQNYDRPDFPRWQYKVLKGVLNHHTVYLH